MCYNRQNILGMFSLCPDFVTTACIASIRYELYVSILNKFVLYNAAGGSSHFICSMNV